MRWIPGAQGAGGGGVGPPGPPGVSADVVKGWLSAPTLVPVGAPTTISFDQLETTGPVYFNGTANVNLPAGAYALTFGVIWTPTVPWVGTVAGTWAWFAPALALEGLIYTLDPSLPVTGYFGGTFRLPAAATCTMQFSTNGVDEYTADQNNIAATISLVKYA